LVLDVLAAELTLHGVCLPDVAHDAAAVATAVRHEHQLRQAVNAMCSACRLAPECLKWRNRSGHGRMVKMTGKRAGSRRPRRPLNLRVTLERSSGRGTRNWSNSATIGCTPQA